MAFNDDQSHVLDELSVYLGGFTEISVPLSSGRQGFGDLSHVPTSQHLVLCNIYYAFY